MTEQYSVYQHWDPLKVCLVGRSYAPEFYSYITNPRVRTVFEKIAEETEEDYQKLIKLLESFGVEVLRPEIEQYLEITDSSQLAPPPMTPRDYSITLGSNFFLNCFGKKITNSDIELAPSNENNFTDIRWKNIIEKLLPKFNNVYGGSKLVPMEFSNFNSAMISRIGKDVYCGTEIIPHLGPDIFKRNIDVLKKYFPEYRWHIVNTEGHLDGTFCPVAPGLIVSLHDIPTYEKTFPDWEVIYLHNQSWAKVQPFLKLKEKNRGKWWVPGQELNDDFTKFVEQWMRHWVGYVEETVFDVNMLVIDEKNVVCNNYNEAVFKAFDRYGVTPHVINFRHRYFWDGGLHCITSDIHREGTMKDYFPERREL